MARVWKLVSAIAFILFFTHNVRGEDYSSAELMKLSSCGRDCFSTAIQNTTCSPTDLSCICTDSTFPNSALECVHANCTVREALELQNIEHKACNRPVRSRKGLLLIPLAAEIPAWACPWIRLYSRWTTTSRLEVDDWIMLIVGLLYSTFIVLGQYVSERSFGVDIWTLDPDSVTMSFKLFYINESFYLATMCLCKVSMLFLYLRVFPSLKFRKVVYGALTLTVLPTLVIIFLQIFQCIPINYIWEGWLHPGYVGYCLDINILIFVSTGFSIVQDLVILVLPLPTLFQLNINIRAKIGLVFMFGLGLFVTAVSCLRTQYIINFHRTNTNPTWEYVNLIIWTDLEVAISVIVTCLPAIWVLMRQLLPWLVDSVSSGYIKTSSGTDHDSMWKKKPIIKGEIRHMVILHDNHDGKNDGSMAELAQPPVAHVHYSQGFGQPRRYGSSPTLGSGFQVNRPKSIGTETTGSGLSNYHNAF